MRWVDAAAALTVKIARNAKPGDGTLFVYFLNKEAFFNRFYLHIKNGLKASLNVDAESYLQARIR